MHNKKFYDTLKYNQSKGAYKTKLHLKGNIRDVNGKVHIVDGEYYLNNYGNEIYSLISPNSIDFSAKRRDILPTVFRICYDSNPDRWKYNRKLIYTDCKHQDGDIFDGCLISILAIGFCTILFKGWLIALLIIIFALLWISKKYN